MSIRPIRTENTTTVDSTVALPIARSLLGIDPWDVVLVTGVVMLVVGVGIVVGALVNALVGVGSALIVSGLLFMAGALQGAHNTGNAASSANEAER